VNLATELEASLKEFLAAGLVDLHENGGRTSFAGGLSWEVRRTAAGPSAGIPRGAGAALPSLDRRTLEVSFP